MLQDKLNLFHDFTKRLLTIVDGLKLKNKDSVKNLILKIRTLFLSEQIRSQVFGSDTAQKLKNYPTNGFCGVACFAFVDAVKDTNWQVMYINETWTYGSHFYLLYKPTKTIIDLTADQFISDGIKDIPYWMGRKATKSEYFQDKIERFALAMLCPNTQHTAMKPKAY